MPRSTVDWNSNGGPEPPEHVGVAPSEVLGDEIGGHAFECGVVEAAGEILQLGSARPGIALPAVADGGGEMEGAQGVLHGAPVGEEALVGGVVLGRPGGLVGRLGHQSEGSVGGAKDRGLVRRWPEPARPSVVNRKVGPNEGR